MDKNAFMRACREGGKAIEQALRALDRSFFSTLYRESQRCLRDADTARDVVQETFIKVWRHCATFRAQSELLPWIRSILRRCILDRLRGTVAETATAMEDDTHDELERRIQELSSQHVPTPDDETRRQQLAQCFMKCWRNFESASPQHAVVMAWIVDDGMSNEEISQLLGRTPGATREFISQCRKRARSHLAEWYELAFRVGGS